MDKFASIELFLPSTGDASGKAFYALQLPQSKPNNWNLVMILTAVT